MNLTSLFSSDSLLKFQREKKPIEFQPKKQIDVNAIPIDESEKIALEDKQKQKLLKKAKRKDRKPKHEKVSDVIETNGEVADNSSNDIDSNVENQSSDIPVSQDDRTVFIGNLSVKETNKTIKELMSEFGEVDSIRLRSVPIAGTAVDEEGNQNLVRKVCVNNRKFGDQKGSFNAYVVLKDPKSVKLALDASNRVVNGRHIRIDTLKPTLFDTKLTLFLGGLPHYCDEEDLRNYFANVLPNGQDDIECVRIIRDPNTLIGKGIGYLLLKDTDAKLAALGLHEVSTNSIYLLQSL